MATPTDNPKSVDTILSPKPRDLRITTIVAIKTAMHSRRPSKRMPQKLIALLAGRLGVA
jgi:hypothetical protein